MAPQGRQQFLHSITSTSGYYGSHRARKDIPTALQEALAAANGKRPMLPKANKKKRGK